MIDVHTVSALPCSMLRESHGAGLVQYIDQDYAVNQWMAFIIRCTAHGFGRLLRLIWGINEVGRQTELTS